MTSESENVSLKSISRTAELEHLEILQAFLTDCATQFGLDPRRTRLLTVALEEIFVNICHYAYPQGPGPVNMSCQSEGERLVVRIVDEGQPFDAASVAAPDLEADIESRKSAGWAGSSCGKRWMTCTVIGRTGAISSA